MFAKIATPIMKGVMIVVIKTKRLPIGNENMGHNWIEKIRDLSGDDVANKIKLINEISFNVPIYAFGTDQIVCYIPETNDWYLEFPEEITITY